MDPHLPNDSTVWELWHSDTFDREAPRSLQASGTNLLRGLRELWHSTLKEGILDNGNASFSCFHLTWEGTPVTRVDVFVTPFGNPALLQLRRWAHFLSEDREREAGQITQSLAAQKDALLLRLAQLHYTSLKTSTRWNASAIDWSAEAREVLARVESISGSEEL